MTPRKHAELIKAWADGAEIQLLRSDGLWTDIETPHWESSIIYRIKPVPKEDYSERGFILFFNRNISSAPVNVTFSGETGEPKKVEIVK